MRARVTSMFNIKRSSLQVTLKMPTKLQNSFLSDLLLYLKDNHHRFFFIQFFLWTFIAWARRRRWSLLVQRQHRQTLRTWEAACNEKTKIGQQDCSNFNGGKQLQRDEDHDNCNGKASALQCLRSRVQQRLCQLR